MRVDLSELAASKPIGISADFVDRVEKLLSVKLPDQLIELLDRVIGMEMKGDVVFQLNAKDQTPFSYFLTGEEIIDHLQEERLEEDTHIGLPIGYDGGGGTFYLRHLNNFDVYLVDVAFCRDVIAPNVVAKTLTDFLLGLRIDDTPIRKEDFEGSSAWIDPEFEKELLELEKRTGREIFQTSYPRK